MNGRLINMKKNALLRVSTAAVAIVFAASACGDSESISSGGAGLDQGSPPTTVAAETPDDPVTSVPGEPDEPVVNDMNDNERQFVGLSQEDAGALAESQARPWRVGRVDDDHFALTEDYRVGRVTLEIDDGLVTNATIEGPLQGDVGPPTTVIGPTSNELISSAIVRIISEDNSFGGGVPFDLVYIATLISEDFSDLDPLALDQVAAALAGRVELEFIADAEGKITDLFADEEASVGLTAVVSVDDIRIADGTAEIDLGLWCGSLCGIWLTYAAELVDGAWQITGTTGPIAVS